MPVSELLARTSSRELSEWMAFDGIEPLADRRLDVLLAMFMALFANANRDRKKQRRAFKIEDFLPQWDKPERQEQSGAHMLHMVEMLNAALGGKDLRQKGEPAGEAETD